MDSGKKSHHFVGLTTYVTNVAYAAHTVFAINPGDIRWEPQLVCLSPIKTLLLI